MAPAAAATLQASVLFLSGPAAADHVAAPVLVLAAPATAAAVAPKQHLFLPLLAAGVFAAASAAAHLLSKQGIPSAAASWLVVFAALCLPPGVTSGLVPRPRREDSLCCGAGAASCTCYCLAEPPHGS